MGGLPSCYGLTMGQVLSKSDPYECNFKRRDRIVDKTTGALIAEVYHYGGGRNKDLVESLAGSTLPREKKGFIFNEKKLKELEDAPRKDHYADKLAGPSGSSAYIAFGKMGQSSTTNNFFMPIDGILDSDDEFEIIDKCDLREDETPGQMY